MLKDYRDFGKEYGPDHIDDEIDELLTFDTLLKESPQITLEIKQNFRMLANIIKNRFNSKFKEMEDELCAYRDEIEDLQNDMASLKEENVQLHKVIQDKDFFE